MFSKSSYASPMFYLGWHHFVYLIFYQFPISSTLKLCWVLSELCPSCFTRSASRLCEPLHVPCSPSSFSLSLLYVQPPSLVMGEACYISSYCSLYMRRSPKKRGLFLFYSSKNEYQVTYQSTTKQFSPHNPIFFTLFL